MTHQHHHSSLIPHPKGWDVRSQLAHVQADRQRLREEHDEIATQHDQWRLALEDAITDAWLEMYALIQEGEDTLARLSDALERTRHAQREDLQHRLEQARRPWNKLRALCHPSARFAFLREVEQLKRAVEAPPLTEEQRHLQRKIQFQEQALARLKQSTSPYETLAMRECQRHLHHVETRQQQVLHLISRKEREITALERQLADEQFADLFIEELRKGMQRLTPSALGFGKTPSSEIEPTIAPPIVLPS